MKVVKGWAVVDGQGNININTVSAGRQAAIINWLMVVEGIATLRWADEKAVEEVWEQRRQDATVVIVEVSG